jgi:multiple sugar transport system permease protein
MTKSQQKFILDIVTYVLLIMGAVLMITPFLWMVATSFKLPADQFTKTLIPNPATLNNFKELFGTHIDFPLLFF